MWARAVARGDALMTTEWKPVRVTRLERELSHEQERERTLSQEREECRDRIAYIENEISREMHRDDESAG